LPTPSITLAVFHISLKTRYLSISMVIWQITVTAIFKAGRCELSQTAALFTGSGNGVQPYRIPALIF
jgi:hypothetical protein